jgi:hypothetical protein
MSRIFIYILSGILLLAVVARAEDTYLNCKWESGRIVKENGIILEKVLKKGDLGTNDQLIAIDFNRKKIISSPGGSESDNKPGGSESDNKVHNWDDKSINWHIEKKKEKVSYIYRLDRISGRLEQIYLDEIHKDQIKHSYICIKTQRKF